jgi:hypothetical protein
MAALLYLALFHRSETSALVWTALLAVWLAPPLLIALGARRQHDKM